MKIRAVSRHQDNPRLHDGKTWTPFGLSYLAGLRELGEGTVLYRRLYLGEWCAAEGVVWETLKTTRHVIPRPWDESTDKPLNLHEALGIQWYFGSQDWGFQDPGVLQIWGVAPDGSPYKDAAKAGPVMFRVAEVYYTQKNLDWWADRMVELHHEFQLEALVCDPSRQDAIDIYNARVGSVHEDPSLRFARGADNRRKAHVGSGDMGGIALVRQWFREDRIFFLRDSTRFGIDKSLKDRKRFYETSLSLPSYVYAIPKPGHREEERTAPGCQDDGADCTRYGVAFVASHDLRPERPPVKNPRAIEQVARHWEVQFDDR